MATNFRNIQDGGFRLVPRSTDPSSPVSGDIFFSDGTPRALGLWQYNGSIWIQLAASSSVLAQSTKTTTYTLTTTDQIILADASGGAFTLTLPAASGNTGLTFYITKIDSSTNIVTIDGNSSETIDGTTTKLLGSQYDSIVITCNGSNWFSVSKDYDIATRCKTAAGQSIPNATDTVVDFGTKDFDTHNAVTTGASWKFTAPEAGKYLVEAMIKFTSGGGWASGETATIKIRKNGSSQKDVENTQQAGHSNSVVIVATDTVSLAATDYIEIVARQNSGASLSLSADDVVNTVSIHRLGN
jgi:hypothetical protein